MMPRTWLRLLVACALVASCDSEREPTRTEPLGPESAKPGFEATMLQISQQRIERLEVTRPGERPITLERKGNDWHIVSPISYPANFAKVDPMLAVLAELQVLRVHAPRPETAHRLGENAGIRVRAWSDGKATELTIGGSQGEETYIQRQGDETVYAVLGRCRKLFDLSLTKLRDPSILELELRDIERVDFQNSYGEIALVSEGADGKRFVEAKPALENFYVERASKSVAVLSALYAKGFVDTSTASATTGLDLETTARATIFLREEKEPIVVQIGARSADGLLHVRTSQSGQVFLVSAHLGSSLIPDPARLQRSEQEMQETRRFDEKRAASSSRNSDEANTHADHEHAKALPSRVPAKLMKELRAMAANQRGGASRR